MKLISAFLGVESVLLEKKKTNSTVFEVDTLDISVNLKELLVQLGFELLKN